jgi:hypothetical protein
MLVLIPCRNCPKTLRIPEYVLGRSVKCPVCGGVFLSRADEARPAPPPSRPHLALDDEPPRAPEPVRRPAEVAPVEEVEDEPLPVEEAAPAAADEDLEEYAEVELAEPAEGAAQKSKRRLPWYMLLLALLPAGLAPGFPCGAAFANIGLEVFTTLVIGLVAAIVLTALGLIVALLPIRVWMRVLGCLLLLLIGYGGSLAWMGWAYLHQPGVRRAAALDAPRRESFASANAARADVCP